MSFKLTNIPESCYHPDLPPELRAEIAGQQDLIDSQRFSDFSLNMITVKDRCIFLRLYTCISFKLYSRICSLTVYSESDAALSCKCVVCDGDLHIINPVVWQSEVVEKQSPILEHQDAVTILRSQSPDDVSSYWLDNSDGLFPLELPLDDRQVEAEAVITDWQKSLSSYWTSDESVGDGHVHCQHLTWEEHRRGPCLKCPQHSNMKMAHSQKGKPKLCFYLFLFFLYP